MCEGLEEDYADIRRLYGDDFVGERVRPDLVAQKTTDSPLRAADT